MRSWAKRLFLWQNIVRHRAINGSWWAHSDHCIITTRSICIPFGILSTLYMEYQVRGARRWLGRLLLLQNTAGKKPQNWMLDVPPLWLKWRDWHKLKGSLEDNSPSLSLLWMCRPFSVSWSEHISGNTVSYCIDCLLSSLQGPLWYFFALNHYSFFLRRAGYRAGWNIWVCCPFITCFYWLKPANLLQ